MYFIEFFFILVGLFQSTFKYAATLSCHTNLKVNLTIMSTQESEGGEDNYEILRQCLKKPCTNLLRKILLKRFNRCDDIVRAIPLEEVSDQTRTALANKSKIKSLHFKVLCDIFSIWCLQWLYWSSGDWLAVSRGGRRSSNGKW